MNTLKRLWTSSTGLIKRFNIHPAPDVVFIKFREEVQEFQDAIFDPDDTGDPLEEAIDIFVTTLNCLNSLGYDYAKIEAAIDKVILKNDAKNWTTHLVSEAGTIERIGRIQRER